MKTKYNKKSATEIEVVSTPEAKEVTNIYDFDFLKSQEVSITNQKNEFVQARDKELLEVRTLISECEKLGICSKIEVEK